MNLRFRRRKSGLVWAETLKGADWKKAKDSNGNGGNNCVEVAVLDTGVAVRDSKYPHGPALIFTPTEWAAFLGGARKGEFDG